MDGVTGDGVRTQGVGGFRLAVGDLSQTLPESPVSWFCSLSEYSCLAFLTSLL